jgi:hypothetical protein
VKVLYVCANALFYVIAVRLLAGTWGSFTAVTAFYDCPLWQPDLVGDPCCGILHILILTFDPNQNILKGSRIFLP